MRTQGQIVEPEIIQEMLNRGLFISDIAKYFHCSTCKISNIIKKHKIKCRSKREAQRLVKQKRLGFYGNGISLKKGV